MGLAWINRTKLWRSKFSYVDQQSCLACTICIIIEMNMGASDMPLQLEFDYRFSRSIKRYLKRQCSTPYLYFAHSISYTTHTPVSLQKRILSPSEVTSPKDKTSSELANRFPRWVTGELFTARAFQKTVRNVTTKLNPATLPGQLSLLICMQWAHQTSSHLILPN